jgi:hypothetical protein
MENTKKIVALILGISFIVGTLFIANAYKYKTKKSQTILVTGAAEYDFVSDLVVWEGSFNRQSFEMKEAYASLKDDQQKVKNYLTQKEIKPSEITFSAITINKDFVSSRDEYGNFTQRFNGYNLSSNVIVESKEINKVENISKDIAQLIDRGIEINSYAPRYYYTKLKNLKIDLLAKASEDANVRAKTIAKNSNSSLGKLLKANMGIFQITGQNSDEDYSYGGTFNTSSKNKTASITVKAEYQIK